MAVGVSAAALQGANVFTNDFDIWLEKLEFFKLAAIAKRFGGVALFTEWHGVQVHLPEETAIDVVLSVTGWIHSAPHGDARNAFAWATQKSGCSISRTSSRARKCSVARRTSGRCHN